MDRVTMLLHWATGAGLSAFDDRLRLRRKARQDRVSLAREAADRLLPALRQLRDMARNSTSDEHYDCLGRRDLNERILASGHAMTAGGQRSIEFRSPT